MNKFSLDIETMLNPLSFEFLPKVEASKTLKDPEKIKADIEKKEIEQIQKMSLSPLYGQIACIGLLNADDKVCAIGNEADIISDFRDFVEINTTNHYFSWNGNGFDWDFIIKRGLAYGIYKLSDLKRYTQRGNPYHTDLMVEFCGYNKFAKLGDISQIYLGRGKKDFDVSQISELIKTKKGQDLIKEYCLEDCQLTYDLAMKWGY